MAEARRQHDWNVASTIMALMAEMNRDRKRRRKPFKPDDFNPYADQKPIVARGTAEQAASMFGANFRKTLKTHPSESQAHVSSQSRRSLRRADREGAAQFLKDSGCGRSG